MIFLVNILEYRLSEIVGVLVLLETDEGFGLKRLPFIQTIRGEALAVGYFLMQR